MVVLGVWLAGWLASCALLVWAWRGGPGLADYLAYGLLFVLIWPWFLGVVLAWMLRRLR